MTVCLCVLIFTCVFRPLYRHVELDSVGEIMILMIETEKGYIRSMSCLCERILLFSCLTVFFLLCVRLLFYSCLYVPFSLVWFIQGQTPAAFHFIHDIFTLLSFQTKQHSSLHKTHPAPPPPSFPGRMQSTQC